MKRFKLLPQAVRINFGALGLPLRPRRATPLEALMPGKLGLPEILLILAVALLLFGPSKLGQLGKGLGEGIRNFKSAMKEGEEGEEKKP